jgi:hypothetical protein
MKQRLAVAENGSKEDSDGKTSFLEDVKRQCQHLRSGLDDSLLLNPAQVPSI